MWTTVPSADDPKILAGFLVRVVYQVDPTVVNAIIIDHIKDCDTAYDKMVKRSRERYFDPSGQAYKRFRSESYIKTCEWYWGHRHIGERAHGFQDLGSDVNPFRPFRVFSLEMALKKMRYSRAHADYTDIRNYIRGEPGAQEISMPRDGQMTFLLRASQLNPMRMRKVFFPHIPRPNMDDNEEFINFRKSSGLNAAVHDDDDGDEVDSEASNHDQMDDMMRVAYDRLATSAEVEPSNSLQDFKDHVSAEYARCRQESNGDSRRHLELHYQAQCELVYEFFDIILTEDETADCGDAVRALARHKNKFLRSHRNFKMPTPKATRNLSRFGDLLCMEACTLESTWAVAHAHQEVKSIRNASLHVYFYSSFQPHTACLGPPGSGKSNAFQINITRLIEGTSRDIGAESSKAKNTSGKKTDLMIEYFEDIPPGSLGVSAYGGSGSGSASVTSNTDQESMLKYRLTKGRVRNIYKMVQNGMHTMVEIDSFCNSVMIVGANIVFHKIPRSLSDRFNVMQFTYKSRTDVLGNDQGMFGRYALAQDPALNPLRATMITRDQRNQLFHAIIQLLCWTGVFEKPDMTVPNLIWGLALAKAKALGLHETGNIRHFERLKFHGETLVVEDAIDRVLDSELSPLPLDKPWHPLDVLHFEKHLFGTTEHAAFTMGLLQHQYDLPIIQAVERYFKTVLLRNKIANGDVGRRDCNPTVERELSYYYVLKLNNITSSTSFHDRNGGSHEQLVAFAKHTFRSMFPQPDENEVIYAIECLVSLEIQVDNKDRPGEKIAIPSLAFSKDGEVMIAEAMVRNHEPNRMQKCIREVLTHEFTKPKNILYGRTKESTPFVWQSMKIQPVKGRRLTMERPGYFSPTVLKMTRNSAIGVGATAHAPIKAELSPDEIVQGAFDEIFSDTNQKVVDMDLDEWAARRRADKLGLEHFQESTDAPGGSASVDAFTAACVRIALQGPSELGYYPVCFGETQPLVYRNAIEADKVANPEKYSLRATLKRKRNENDEGEIEGIASLLIHEDEPGADADDDQLQYSDADVDDEPDEDEADEDEPMPVHAPVHIFQRAPSEGYIGRDTVTDNEIAALYESHAETQSNLHRAVPASSAVVPYDAFGPR
jgi:hypothetical protein